MGGTESAIPTWIASGQGQLSAWVHEPSGRRARGSVVLVPPVGREFVVATRAWVVLARQLARAGHLVVRADLRGIGDSSALPSGSPVEAWQQDVRAAVDHAQQLLPGVPTAVVGLRLGASIAAVVEHPALGERILWEPVAGRRWLRQQATLRKMSVRIPVVEASSGTELPGLVFSPVQAAAVSALPAPSTDDPRVRRECDAEASANLYDGHPAHVRLPLEAIDEVVTALPVVDAREVADWSPVSVAEVAPGVVEEHVQVGPDRLPGILGRPTNGEPSRAVLLCPSGSEAKCGPTGLWTVAARALVEAGSASLRLERRGTGDLLDEAEATEPAPYRESVVEDLARGAAFLREQCPGRLVLAGLSAGGWAALRVAERTPVDEVVVVNNLGWHREAERYRHLGGPSLRERLLRTAVPTGDETEDEPSVEAEPSQEDARPSLKRRVAPVVHGLLDGARRCVPVPVRMVLARRGLLMDPGVLLEGVPMPTRVVLVQGVRESNLWLGLRGDDRVAAMRRRGHDVEVLAVQQLDHSLLGQAGRSWVVEHLADREQPFVAV